ncbi:MAG: hypothetical protein QOH08_1771 [Chloroflexota bacterium]|nr:hypothetical protein [Chloroflexota bacterium]
MRCLVVLAIVLAACAPGAASAGSVAPSAAPSAASPSPSRSPAAAAHAYREVAALGDFQLLAPDGQTVWSFVQGGKGTTSYFAFQRLDGSVVGRLDNLTAMGRPEWLPDSSAMFVELAAGQRAGPLGVLQTDGRLIETLLDDANPALSPDGRWIAAERQEGCCADIRIHEIRIAPREGGPLRTLVTSTDPTIQPVALLGWSPDGEVVYRDGPHVRSVTLGGRITELPAPAGAARPLSRSGTAPDGQVILACAADPLAFWTIAGGRVVDLPLQPAWPLRLPWCSTREEVMWLGGHELLLRDDAGQLRAYDPTTGATRAIALSPGAALLGASGDALLLSIDGDLHVASAATGAAHAVGLGYGKDFSVRSLDGGRFFVRTGGKSGYLVE